MGIDENKSTLNDGINSHIKLVLDKERDFIALVYLSQMYKLDLLSLIMLYEKFGKDVLFIFYLFSGKKVTFPSQSKLSKVMSSSTKLLDIIDGRLNRSDAKITSQEEKILDVLVDMYNKNSEKFILYVGKEEFNYDE